MFICLFLYMQCNPPITISFSFSTSSPLSVLHLAIIHNHQDVVLQLLDVLPQLPPTETPVVDCLNNFKQVCCTGFCTTSDCIDYSSLCKCVCVCVCLRELFQYQNATIISFNMLGYAVVTKPYTITHMKNNLSTISSSSSSSSSLHSILL